MRKRQGIVLAAMVAVVVATALGSLWFFSTHTHVAGHYYANQAPILDLRGRDVSPQDYDAICQALPETRVLWDLPFQGGTLPLDTKALTVAALSQSDIPLLERLTELKTVDGTACRDLDALICLQKALPACEVSYIVPIGDSQCRSQDTDLTLDSPQAEEILKALPYLPNLHKLTITGTLPTPAEVSAVTAGGNRLDVVCQLPLGGEIYETDAETLPLSGNGVEFEKLKKALPYFTRLTSVDLTGSGFPQAQKQALADAFPKVFFLTEWTIGGKTFSTDAASVDLSGIAMTVEEAEAFLPYFKNLTHVYMSDCGISNEDMDALNRRHQDVRYVWTVYCGSMPVRTDTKEFYPARISRPYEVYGTQCDNLRYCPDIITVDIGHMSVSNCEWAAYMPHLKYLLIPMSNVTDLTPLENLKELVFLEAYTIEVKDYSPLLGCTALEDLNISLTYADYTPLTQMTWLKNLYWMGCPGGEKTAEILRKALPNTEILVSLEHEQGGYWRYLPNYYRMRDSIGAGYLGQSGMLLYWTQEEANEILACSFHPENPVEPVLERILARREAEKKAGAQTAAP